MPISVVRRSQQWESATVSSVAVPFDPYSMRIGNTERDAAIQALNEHYAAGRLQLDEFEQRVSRASVGHTLSELGALFDDLPAPHPAFLAPPAQTMPPVFPPGPPPRGYAPQGYPSQGYARPGYNPYAPYGYDPLTGMPLSDKSKVVAGILQLFLGGFGVGRFYTGHIGMAIAQLLTCGGCGIWSLVDAIILLVNGGTDAQGRKLRD
jgi:hypothetical protein